MIDQSVIEEIKARNDIVDLISSYVSLKRAGSNMLGLCPFHSEKTPSFTVFPARQGYYCFGCGAGGDVITFVRQIENLEYVPALEFLAKRVGITIPADTTRRGDGFDRARMLNMNKEAARFFRECLFDPQIGAEARAYFEKRALSTATIKHFGLGYSPNGFSALTNRLRELGYTDAEMTAGFLCGRSRKTGAPFDYFRNRIMFPIIDVSGNVIAFGGRVMDDSLPKYLNSSDTPVFKKSRNLFALNFARASCAEEMILCEGYMDVIAMHAAGFTNAVATLGTALTPEQARIMARYTKRVVISYDSDAPGQKAANRAIGILGEVGLDVRVLRIEGAKDPDEFIKKYGADKFRQQLSGSFGKFDFNMDGILTRHNIAIPDEKIKACAELTDLAAGIYSSAEREVYIAAAAKKLDIPASARMSNGSCAKRKANTKKSSRRRSSAKAPGTATGSTPISPRMSPLQRQKRQSSACCSFTPSTARRCGRGRLHSPQRTFSPTSADAYLRRLRRMTGTAASAPRCSGSTSRPRKRAGSHGCSCHAAHSATTALRSSPTMLPPCGGSARQRQTAATAWTIFWS